MKTIRTLFFALLCAAGVQGNKIIRYYFAILD